MSTDTEHAHAFARDMTGLCRCGMTADQYQLQQALDSIASVKHKIIVLPPGTKTAPHSTVDEPLPIAGRLIITWPRKPLGPFVYPVELEFQDAATGMPIVTILSVNLHFGFGGDEIRNNMLVAELTMCCDEDGKPLIATRERESLVERYGPDGEPLIGTFNFIVVESRLRP